MGIEILYLIFFIGIIFAVTSGASKPASPKFDKKFPPGDKNKKP